MDTPFAFRYWQIKPNEPWRDDSNIHPPMPPEQWRRDGFSQDWYIWRKESSGPLEEDQIVTPFRSTSVVWCQQSQKYWFVPRDCTETTQRSAENDPEVWDNWHPLFFYDLGSETQRPRPGLWKILPTGLKRQHDGGCPRNFDEFLPKHFFFFGGDTQDTRCHFIGDLSLMLALLAMCPRKPDKILEQISQKFYANNSSRFESSEDPIDRSGMCFEPSHDIHITDYPSETGTSSGYASSDCHQR